jgi:hypothetical protein
MRSDGQPELQAFRATLRKRVTVRGISLKAVFVMARGGVPSLPIESAMFATSDMVANLAASNGIQINGDVCSARRLYRSEHLWKAFQSFDEIFAHKHLAPTVSREDILESYTLLRSSVEDAEV